MNKIRYILIIALLVTTLLAPATETKANSPKMMRFILPHHVVIVGAIIRTDGDMYILQLAHGSAMLRIGYPISITPYQPKVGYIRKLAHAHRPRSRTSIRMARRSPSHFPNTGRMIMSRTLF